MHGSQQDPAHRQRFLQEGAAGKDVERDRLAPTRAGASATCTASPRMVPRRVGETCEQRGGFWLAGRVGRARDVRWASAAPTGSQSVARAHEGTLAACLEEAPLLRVTRAHAQIAPCHLNGLGGGRRALHPACKARWKRLLISSWFTIFTHCKSSDSLCYVTFVHTLARRAVTPVGTGDV